MYNFSICVSEFLGSFGEDRALHRHCEEAQPTKQSMPGGAMDCFPRLKAGVAMTMEGAKGAAWAASPPGQASLRWRRMMS
jgi:hypothetical protein